MKKDQFLSTTELADILGISRIAVFNKIKLGQIKAQKVGRNYIIDRNDLGPILGESLSPKQKSDIDKAVKKTVKEYGETLKSLGNA